MSLVRRLHPLPSQSSRRRFSKFLKLYSPMGHFVHFHSLTIQSLIDDEEEWEILNQTFYFPHGIMRKESS